MKGLFNGGEEFLKKLYLIIIFNFIIKIRQQFFI